MYSRFIFTGGKDFLRNYVLFIVERLLYVLDTFDPFQNDLPETMDVSEMQIEY